MLILTVIQGPEQGRRFEFPQDEPQFIGRSSESLPLRDHTISRRHAELTPDNGDWFLRDLESTNGTFVNGIRVSGRYRLKRGDQIRTGSTVMIYGEQRKAADEIELEHEEDEEFWSADSEVPSNEDSMIMAVPEPAQAAQFQLKVLYELTELIGSLTDQDQLLDKVVDVVLEYFEADHGAILLADSPEAEPEPRVLRHRVRPKTAGPAKVPVSRTIIKYVLQNEVGVLSSNAMSDQRFMAGESVHSLRIRSVLCVPIKFKDRLFGVIYLDSQVANYTFTDDQLNLLTAIGVQTGLAIANAETYEKRIRNERLAVVGETVASLSHSVKNILQGLRGGADLVELGIKKKKTDLLTNGWEIVSRNLDRIYQLTMNMLAFSKQRQAELEMTYLGKLLDEVVELAQGQFDQKKVALLVDVAEDLPPVPVDSSGIHQAVLNLLTNALDAVKPDTGAVVLSCVYDAEKQEVRIAVRDNGTGISTGARKRLFEPFYSTKGLRGTGLGLVVTRKIVKEHEGRIEVETGEGKGSTFTLILPCKSDEEVEEQKGDTMNP